MPQLARGIRLNAKHRNHQPRSTSRHGLQNADISRAKVRAIQRHLPTLPARQPRLLANIRHHCGKLLHFVAAAG